MGKNQDLKLLERYKGFFDELTAEKIMNSSIISLNDKNTIREAQIIMKNEQISGIPIVNQKHELINIITMEDILNTLEEGGIEKTIEKLGNKKIVSLCKGDKFEKIIDYMTKYGYGRYPVVDSEKKLLGIITKQDILFTILRKLSVLYLHDERRKEILDSPLSIMIKNKINKNLSDFFYEIKNKDVNNAGEGSALLKNYLKEKCFTKKLIRNISIATYEAEVNVVIHGGGVGKIICQIEENAIIIVIEDVGPGIENVDKAMQVGYSTAPEYIRALGFGAGMGLANIKRFADKLMITSEKDHGTRVEMLFWKEEE